MSLPDAVEVNRQIGIGHDHQRSVQVYWRGSSHGLSHGGTGCSHTALLHDVLPEFFSLGLSFAPVVKLRSGLGQRIRNLIKLRDGLAGIGQVQLQVIQVVCCDAAGQQAAGNGR